MAKGDVVLVPVVLQSTDPEELARMVTAERIKKGQVAAHAHYTSVWVHRHTPGQGFTKFTAFVEFMVEEK